MRACNFVIEKTYRNHYFLVIVWDFLGSGAWICQLGAWNCQSGAWTCLLGAWNCFLGAWNCLLGAWTCLLGAWTCLLGAWICLLGELLQRNARQSASAGARQNNIDAELCLVYSETHQDWHSRASKGSREQPVTRISSNHQTPFYKVT